MILGACASVGGVAMNSAEPQYAGERSAVGGADVYMGDVAQEAPAALPQDGVASDELAASSVAQQDIQRLIIRTGSVSLSAEDTRVAKASIEAMINEMASAGAFIVNSNEYGGSEDVSPYINMQIRVPAERFNEAMDRIVALAVEGTTPTRNEFWG